MWCFGSAKGLSADTPKAEEPCIKVLVLALKPFVTERADGKDWGADVMLALIVLVVFNSNSNREKFFFCAASSVSKDLIRCSNSVSRFLALSFSSSSRRSRSVISARDVSVSMIVVDRMSAYKLATSVPGLVYR